MPKLALFPHVAGSRVARGLFETAFVHPDGSHVYYHYRKGSHEEGCEYRNEPPAPPWQLTDICASGLPPIPPSPYQSAARTATVACRCRWSLRRRRPRHAPTPAPMGGNMVSYGALYQIRLHCGWTSFQNHAARRRLNEACPRRRRRPIRTRGTSCDKTRRGDRVGGSRTVATTTTPIRFTSTRLRTTGRSDDEGASRSGGLCVHRLSAPAATARPRPRSRRV